MSGDAGAERTGGQPAARRLRCPFCHDALPADADHDRVACAACGAEHHAACVLEGQGCSATGCAGREVTLGAAVLGLDELALVVRDPTRLVRLARPRVWPALARLITAGLTVAGVVAVVLFAAAGKLEVLPALAVGVIACAALRLLIVAPPRRNRRDPHRERELLGDLGVVVPDPMAPVLEALRQSSSPGPSARRDRALTHCPACEQALDAAEAGEDEPAWFCHHCGASLAAEGTCDE